METPEFPPFTPLFRVYERDALSNLTLVATNGEAGSLRFRAEAGRRYHVLVGSATATGGPLSLNLLLTTPENDDFGDRFTLMGVEAQATGHTIGATCEPGERRELPGGVDHTAWWTWQAPEDGLAQFSLAATNFEGLLAIYRGDSLGDLVRVAWGSTNSVAAAFAVTAGESFQLVVVGGGDYSP